MGNPIRIGTRESQLAVWQATLVQEQLLQHGHPSELVLIKSDGDIDLSTPLYDMGVQGIFTRSLDIALLTGKIDIAVHSMKDVPTQLPKGIMQAAVLERASHKDIFVFKNAEEVREWQLGGTEALSEAFTGSGTIATSSIRRRAQWLNRYPNHTVENLRGNVNTRLRKVQDSNWQGAIFAAAGLERIGLRPANSVDLDWMLPAPAQGAIMVVCRHNDEPCVTACEYLNHVATALCVKIERDFLKTLMGGCSTPISGLAEVKGDKIVFRGNVLSVDGKLKLEHEEESLIKDATPMGNNAALQLLSRGADKLTAAAIKNDA